MSTTDDYCRTSQAIEALRSGDARRMAISRIKEHVRTGSVTIAEIVIDPCEVVEGIRLCDVLKWGWPKVGPVRQAYAGEIAASEGLNLIQTVGEASQKTRERFADILCAVRETSVPADQTISELPSPRRMLPPALAEEMLADLADAVEIHRRSVSDSSAPVERWAQADEVLWQAKNAILGGQWFGVAA